MSDTTAMVEVDSKLFDEVKRQHAHVSELRRAFDDASAELKHARKALEGGQTTLESLIQRLTAPTSDLPLFANQSDVIDQAKSDPVVMKLVDRLLGAGHDVNAIMVAGYTEDERATINAYLDVLDARQRAAAELDADPSCGAVVPDAPEVPDILKPQPMTVIDEAALVARLHEAGRVLTAEALASWTPPIRAEVLDWLTRSEAITAEKGEALTANDLPTAPAAVLALAEVSIEGTGAPADADEEALEDDDDAEDPDPVDVEREASDAQTVEA